MEDKIEVRDYIRTKRGKIGRVIEIYHYNYRNQTSYVINWGNGKVTSIEQFSSVAYLIPEEK